MGARFRVQMFLARVSVLALLAASAAAQEFQYPQSLDVPYVPTNQPTVEAMLRIANVGPEDYVIDLGSGDGRIVITAAKLFGARGFGVDLDPQRVKESLDNAKAAGVTSRAAFYQRNVFDTKLSDATVVTMYLLPRVNLQLRPRLLAELKPGTRIVAHDFNMEDWKPDITASVRGHNSTIYFWTIPARVEGRWSLRTGDARAQELDITQAFQEIQVGVQASGRKTAVRDERLDGARITFTLIDAVDYLRRYRYEGRVSGDTMEGTMRGEGTAQRAEVKWRATRSAR